MSKLLIFILAITCYTLASAEAVVVENDQILANTPKGYCAITDGARRAAMIQSFEAIVGGKESIISVFESCYTKANSAANILSPGYQFGWIGVIRGKKNSLDDSVARPEYLDAAEQSYNQSFPGYSQDPDKRLKAALSTRAAVNENWGKIGRDPNAVYLGSIGTLANDDGKVTLGVTVLGSTLLKGRGFLIHLYEIASESTNVDELLRASQGMAGSFLRDNKPKEYLVSHITCSSEAAAIQALGRLRSGESFDKVAQEVSNDPGTKAKGGRIARWTPADSWSANFAAEVKRLTVGQISTIPIRTEFGWHIVRVDAVR